MIDTLVVNAAPGEMRIALLDGERTVEIYHHRDVALSVLGNLYLGRVTAMLPGAKGAFIDIGLDRPGFLNAGDARTMANDAVTPINRALHEGEAVLVQVSRDALHQKGPRLTMRPTLAGRYLVFSPGQGAIEVSRRITQRLERKRLKQILADVADGTDGFTLRSAAQGVEPPLILADMASLHDAWKEAQARRPQATPPACLWTAPEPLERALMDYPGLRRVIIDDPATLARARRFLPEAVLQPYRHGEPIFESFHVEAALEEAFEARVALLSGAAVIIEETNALCAIDVDSGGARGNLAINLEAAEVIAHQLRLRAIGGIIVIDFLRLTKGSQRRHLIEAMAVFLSPDKDATAPEGFSALGLVEMRRRRTRPSLSEILGAPGEAAKNPATIALDRARAEKR